MTLTLNSTNSLGYSLSLFYSRWLMSFKPIFYLLIQSSHNHYYFYWIIFYYKVTGNITVCLFVFSLIQIAWRDDATINMLTMAETWCATPMYFRPITWGSVKFCPLWNDWMLKWFWSRKLNCRLASVEQGKMICQCYESLLYQGITVLL